MKSMNKNVVIAITVVVLVLAIVSFKIFVLDAGKPDAAAAAAKTEVNQAIQNGPSTPAEVPPQDKPTADGVQLPGNKGKH